MRNLLLSAIAIMIIIISSSAQSSDYPVPIIFKGQTPTLDVRVLGSYQSGFFSNVAPETPPAYDPTTRRIYVFSPIRAAVEILSIDDPSNPIKIAEITDPSGQLGIPSSLAFDRGLLAVALEDPDDTQRGRVVFGDADGNIISPPIEVGIQPEMLAFTPDGRKIVVINKGNAVRYTPEPIDPEASVSIITLRGRGGQSFFPLAETITFERFNGQLDVLRHAGVRIYGPGASVAQDLEPDSVTVSQDSQKAWITLNRNNALAEVDLKSHFITKIIPLGYKDNSLEGNGIDASDVDGRINIATWPLRSLFGPDGIAAYRFRGGTYLVTANEGDPRDLEDFKEDIVVKDVDLDSAAFSEDIKKPEHLGNLRVSKYDGDIDGDGDFDALYAFGGRSLAIWQPDGTRVFESGDQFEQIIAEALPAFFNSSNDTNSFDFTSDDRGPEPEQLAIGRIGAEQYVFIAFERIGGIMIYNISDPTRPRFELYINNRNFNLDPGVECLPTDSPHPKSENCARIGDLEPESVLFIPASRSPTGQPMLVVTHEASDSVTFYGLEPSI